SGRAAARPSIAARSDRRRGRRCSGSRPTSARTATAVLRGVWARRVLPSAAVSLHALQVEAAARDGERTPEIAEFADAPGHVIDAEVLDAESAFHLFPGDGRRHG